MTNNDKTQIAAALTDFASSDIAARLADFDIIFVNSSGGKDSQTMLDLIAELAAEQGVTDRVTVVHADLGRVEWAGTKELAAEQAAAYGFKFVIAPTRPQGDLLVAIEQRGMFPGNGTQYCTSDQKTTQCKTVLTRLVKEWREAEAERLGVKPSKVRQCRVLNCLGMRAQESSRRQKQPAVIENFDAPKWTNGRRQVTRWLPIQDLTEDQVWARIHASGVRYHEAYDLGMPRLSCCFCVFANRDALLISAEHNAALLDEYVTVEKKIGHTMRKDQSLEEIRDAYRAGERGDRHNASFSGGM